MCSPGKAQDIGHPERLAPNIEAVVGGRDQLQRVGLGDHDLADRIVQAEGGGLVLGHGDRSRHRLIGGGDLGLRGVRQADEEKR